MLKPKPKKEFSLSFGDAIVASYDIAKVLFLPMKKFSI